MKKVPRKSVSRKAEDEVVQLGLAGVVRRGLRELVFDAGMAHLHAILEEERAAVCGPRYAQGPDRQARRMGHAPGELVLGGRLVQVRRPRARTLDWQEVTLPSWAEFRREDPLTERAVEQMMLGVATRKYERSLEPVAPGLCTRGTSKSAVSRRFVAATKATVDAWLRRDLSQIDMAVLMIDGMHVEEHVLLVALAIDSEGKKHVLGLHEGATESAASCRALIAELQARGLPTDKPILAVLDGSKALAKAIKNAFNGNVVIQRCQAHKLRNVEEHLPEVMRPSVRKAIQDAYSSRNVERAKRMLGNLVRRLQDEHPGAATSLEEGLDETLTVMGFGLPEWLERCFSTTNAIENIIGSTRKVSARVKRWRNASMVIRWTATGLIEAERHFHKVRDHRGMTLLSSALTKKLGQALAPVAQLA
jgi:putative transposase